MNATYSGFQRRFVNKKMNILSIVHEPERYSRDITSFGHSRGFEEQANDRPANSVHRDHRLDFCFFQNHFSMQFEYERYFPAMEFAGC